jgi:hypothetical protein
MNINYLVVSVVFIVFSSKANTEECLMFFDGLNPINQSTPLISTAKTNIQEDTKQKRLTQINKINSMGIDTYIKYALTGEELSSIGIAGKAYNWLDLALLKNATEETINHLLQIGFNASPHTIPIIYKIYGYAKLIDIINSMTINGLEHTVFDEGSTLYSISSYFLLKKDFEALRYMREKFSFDIDENLTAGQIISLDHFTIEDRLSASSIMDLLQYNKLYKKQMQKNAFVFIKKATFNAEYNIYRLKHNCESIKGSINVKYAVKRSEITKIIEKQRIDLGEIQKGELIESIKNPIVQEYLVNSLELRNRKTPTLKSKSVENYDSLTQDSILSFLNDDDHIYIDNSGITLKEYLFLKNKYSWNQEMIGMSINRLAYFLIKSHFDLSSPNSVGLLRKISLENEKGKNLTYYLLKHAVSSKSINAITKFLPEPTSTYGLNPIEMLHIKSELHRELQDSIQVAARNIKQSYKDRL